MMNKSKSINTRQFQLRDFKPHGNKIHRNDIMTLCSRPIKAHSFFVTFDDIDVMQFDQLNRNVNRNLKKKANLN